jgi:hypothetical protein
MNYSQSDYTPEPVSRPIFHRRRFLRQCCYAGACGLVARAATLDLWGAEPADAVANFGAATASGGTLIGIFYDLKQDQKGKPVNADYLKVFADFVDSGWDEAVLSRFFRVTRPIYATEVFTPYMPASDGPKAFGVENVVEPSHWMVVYKGQVSPPEDGTYRFVGCADDIMAVAVNGKTTLVTLWAGRTNPTNWVPQDPGYKNHRDEIRSGDWFTCRKDQIIDLDILIGEFPGGKSGAWLTYQKKGEQYPISTERGFDG